MGLHDKSSARANVRVAHESLCAVFDAHSNPAMCTRVDATNWGETQKIIEAIHKMPLDGVESRRGADEVINLRSKFLPAPLPPQHPRIDSDNTVR